MSEKIKGVVYLEVSVRCEQCGRYTSMSDGDVSDVVFNRNWSGNAIL